MPSLVPGKSSCTAWASTCAVECRMTARPSALAAGTGSTSASASGVQFRSLRSPVATSRTTTAPSGPLSGTPASLSACIAVVPAGTRTVAVAVDEDGIDTGALQRVVWSDGNVASEPSARPASLRHDFQPGGDRAPPVQDPGDPGGALGVGGDDADGVGADLDPQRHGLGLRHREPPVGAAGEGEAGRDGVLGRVAPGRVLGEVV